MIRKIGVRIAERYGGAFYQSTPDRAVLECQILPYYQLSRAHDTIVFVGTDWYTFGYGRLFKHKRFNTIDVDPARARYGATNHFVAPMQELERHFAPASIDVVFCNGVIGWGLDEIEDGRAALAAAGVVLRQNGHLVLGWNKLDGHDPPFSPVELAEQAGFSLTRLPCLECEIVVVEAEHQHHYAVMARTGPDRPK
jgi:hypothetical protein